MKKVNLNDVAEIERKSPKGRYRAFPREISVALGREPESADLEKRHPFDLTMVRIPAGGALCPYHEHSAQWEMYLVISGRGLIRDESGEHEVTAGDAFLFRPGQAHKLSNAGDADFIYYVIADNPIGDCCHYPDSRKWLYRQGSRRTIIKGPETDYFDGEE
jgi:uncharacterized cupin superfamily protein